MFPPRSNAPGFQSKFIWFVKLETIESSTSPHQASASPLRVLGVRFWRFMLINAVVNFAIGSRSCGVERWAEKGIKAALEQEQEGKEIVQTIQEHGTGIGSWR